MKPIVVLLIYVSCALCHISVTSITIDGKEREDCLRGNNEYGSSKPIWSITPIMSNNNPYLPNGILSDNYTCGYSVSAFKSAVAKCSVAAGKNIDFSYHSKYDGDNPDLNSYLDASHQGPIMVFMAKTPSNNVVKGVKWFKVYELGLVEYSSISYDKSKWACPDVLTQKKGTMTFTVPSDLAPGDYYVRFELIALHAANKPSGAQPYVRCAEITVTGSGSADPTDKYGMVIPSDEYANLNSPGIYYSVFKRPSPGTYTPPGGAIYVSGSSPTPTPVPPTPTPPSPVDPPSPSPSDQTQLVDLFFASKKSLTEGICVLINEPEDIKYTWDNNYICSLNEDISSWKWSHEGPVYGDYNLIQFLEESDPNGWDNNFLAIPTTDRRKYAWSSVGPIPGMKCTLVFEPRDPDAWSDNYFCTAAENANSTGFQSVNVANGVYNSSQSPDQKSETYVALESMSPMLVVNFSIVLVALLM